MIVFTGVETAITKRTVVGNVVVDVVVGIGVLGLALPIWVEHLTTLDVEDPIATVRSALTPSHRAQEMRYPSNIKFLEEAMFSDGRIQESQESQHSRGCGGLDEDPQSLKTLNLNI